MRVSLLALIFFLLLSLGNAFLLRENAAAVNSHAFAIVQLSQGRATHYEWDAFLWREILALILTVFVFGAISAAKSSRHHRRDAHPAFHDRIANRR